MTIVGPVAPQVSAPLPSTMPAKRRKISNLTHEDTNAIVDTLAEYCQALDVEDSETTGLVDDIQKICAKLQAKTQTRFSSGTVLDLSAANIRTKGLEIKEGGRARAEDRSSQEKAGNWFGIENTRALIRLVRKHVSTLAGCRMLINVILLRVASVDSNEEMAVSIVPEYPIHETALNPGHSLVGVVDYLLTRLPTKFTRQVLDYPQMTLARADIKQIGTSNIFEAKNLLAIKHGVPQAALTAATWCERTKIGCMRGAITSGEQWLFFTFERIDVGGIFRCSTVIDLGEDLGNLAYILGILHDWIENSSDINQAYFDEV
ncbi:hypothetical protein JAAARDRAFT_212279, partial [Jaapia argillacea MUCL 33604]